MTQYPYGNQFTQMLAERRPGALALLSGEDNAAGPKGYVRFYEFPEGGLLIQGEFFCLPVFAGEKGPSFFGFHIHENGDCSHHFTKTGDHFNPTKQPHPRHAGDLPPILAWNGYAWCAFFAEGLTISDVLNRSVIIHSRADDFTSQPSGNSGTKIACGVIEAWEP